VATDSITTLQVYTVHVQVHAFKAAGSDGLGFGCHFEVCDTLNEVKKAVVVTQ
jgi:hypothetical protein